MKMLTRAELARYFDHTLASAEATRAEVERFCAEAREHGLHGVCVHGSRVELVRACLEESEVKVTGLVGFPLGALDVDVKRYETEVAIDHGAHEIEAVLNIGRLKDGERGYVLRELRDIVEAADERPVKIILEMSVLTVAETALACELAVDSGADCVCTGTGLRSASTAAEVSRLRPLVGDKLGIKATGGITDLPTALALIAAGARRLGTAASVAIVLSSPS